MKRPVSFGKYLLLDRISVGGMAEVFQAKSFGVEGFEKILAIKRILPSMAEDDEFIEMFIDEAKIAGQLSHPNVCQIFELGKIGKNHFIAMEFVWGKDTLQLQNRFRRLRRRMPLPMAAFIAAKVCEGLDYAHRKRDADGRPLNIIHRDVSPQNILVSYEGEVKIIDFGIATAVSRSSKTQAGVLKGKFGYMSPEQVRGLPLDARSDLFALGTLLYEMCVGERLFTGDGDFAVLEKVRNADVQPPTTHNPAITDDLEQIIMTALARDADDRFQGANEMHDALMGYLMAQEPVFTSKPMAAALKDMFAREHRREQEALEDYKRIAKEALEQYQPSGDAELAVTLLGAPNPPRSSKGPARSNGAPARSTSGPGALAQPPVAHDPLAPVPINGEGPSLDELEDEGATEIGGPAFADLAELDDEDLEELEPLGTGEIEEVGGLQEVVVDSDPGGGFDDEGMTQIYAEGGAPQPAEGAMPAEPTYIFNAEDGEVEHAPDAATVILADASGAARPSPSNGGGVTDSTGQNPTVIFDASAGTGSVSAPPADFAAAAVSGTSPLVTPPRSSIVKDMLIGVLLALVVILAVVVWRVFSSEPEQAPGTVVVTITPPAKVVEVLIDGTSAGMTKPAEPFIRKVTAGQHKVAVLPPNQDPIVRTVDLAAGQLKALSFTIAKAVGHLRLKIEPKDGRVLIDGAEVSAEAARKPLELSANQEHQIHVVGGRPGFREQRFKIRLAPGEEVKRTVKLEAGQVASFGSDPPGAEVFVDGSKRGQTPLTLDDLKPGKYRVIFKLEGHATRYRWIKIDEGKPAALAVKLPKVQPLAAAPTQDKPIKPAIKPAIKPTIKPTIKPIKTGRPPVARKRPGRPPGFLVANASPGWYKVLIDGKDTGRTTPIAPRKKLPLSPGRHRVTFVASGKKHTFRIVIKSGETVRLIKTIQ